MQAAEAIQGLYQMFIAKDCTMVRAAAHIINPDFSLSKTLLSTHIPHSALILNALFPPLQVEVNPFMETTQGNICCVDSKVRAIPNCCQNTHNVNMA